MIQPGAFQILKSRGFLSQCSDEAGLSRLLDAEPVTFYIGFDPTASSLHVGNLLQLFSMSHLQRAGHRPIALIGAGTCRIGDPSGKSEARPILPVETINANGERFRAQIGRFLDFSGDRGLMLDNADWLAGLNYIDFLREIGRHFSVNRMLTMDSVKLRLEREHEMSFIEFNYMICQAYDFVELARRTGCNLQMGGSDQWGNIIMGVDLGRRMGTHQLYALTCPLLTTSAGAKMGKTAAGAVWLNEDQMSPYDYWQFWRNAEDADVAKLLRIFTTLPMDEIARLAALEGAEINEAKKVLATEATALLHGRDKAEAAAKTAAQTFEQGALSEGLPTVEIAAAELAAGLGVLSAFVRAGLVKSNGEARRQIAGGGLRVNDVAVTDEAARLTQQDVSDGVIKLSLGKKRHVLLRPA
jgi:tyrosyl-tRNA synthetase